MAEPEQIEESSDELTEETVKATEDKPEPEPEPEPESDAEPADWRIGITDEANKKTAERFNTLDDAMKTISDYREKQSTAIIKPGKDASEEDIAAFNKALGVPEAVDGYEFDVPEGYEVTDDDKEAQKKWAELFHQEGVTKDAALALNKRLNELTAAAQEQQVADDEQFADESTAALKSEWGKDYDANLEFSNRGMEYLFGDAVTDAREIEMGNDKFLLDNPIMIKALAKIGRETSEATLGPSAMSDETRDSTKNEFNDLKRQQHEAHFRGDNEEVKKLTALIEPLTIKLGGDGPIVGDSDRQT